MLWCQSLLVINQDTGEVRGVTSSLKKPFIAPCQGCDKLLILATAEMQLTNEATHVSRR